MTDHAPKLDALCVLTRAHYRSAMTLIDYLREERDDSIRMDAAEACVLAARSLQRLSEAAAASGPECGPATPAADPAALAMSNDEIERLRSALEAAQQSGERWRAQLEEGQQELKRMADAHERESGELNERIRSLSNDLQQMERERDEASEERHKLQLKLGSYDALLRDGRAERADPIDYDAPPAPTIAGVIEIARAECEQVAIHKTAPREIDALDADEKASDWARELWKGLCALNAYAKEAEFFSGGFWEWCEHSNSEHNVWPATAKKLAMSESDTVMHDGKLQRTRRFNVDSQIDPRGYIHMEAHLKIAEGGGQHIPRLYFYDDTGGRTKLIHIGFIGPHRLVPTSQS